MLSYLVRKRIIKRAKEWNVNIPVNYELIIDSYKKLNILHDNKLIFSYLYDNGSDNINANSLIYKIIFVNAEWAARLVLINDEKTKNAFLFTIGHELTHKEKDFFCMTSSKVDFKFILWINEVHADFGAAQKVANCRMKDLLDSIEYKSTLNKNSDTFTHPSWEHRKKYAESGAFDEKLINQIALDVDCKNETLITDVAKFYKDIILI